MDATATRNVNQIPADEKRTLESLLGSALQPEQHVLILTYTPSALPADKARQAARERIARTIAINQQFAAVEGITADEADAAVDEALSHVRRRL
ncbi:MAG: hypothetical protein SH850_04795 [Planctomycetaceae bacterium]|nr:hypothetical protein [Planctomycetaceae bacterium]